MVMSSVFLVWLPSPPFVVLLAAMVSSIFLVLSPSLPFVVLLAVMDHGVKHISSFIYEETRDVLEIFWRTWVPLPCSALLHHLTLPQVICDSVTYTGHAKQKTVTSLDVIYALKQSGCMLYGYIFYSQLSAAYSLNSFPQFWHIVSFAVHSHVSLYHVIYQFLRGRGNCWTLRLSSKGFTDSL
jgi:histone H4